MQDTHVIHQFEPIYNSKSQILILGTFPSVKSREQNFYYGHPQNRFWKVLAGVLACSAPVTIEEKKEMLLSHGIAIWDVIATCDIEGSSDSSIRNVVPNDLKPILQMAEIGEIYANGTMAKKLYDKYSREKTNREIFGLPSTSPANAAFSLERLIEEWGRIWRNRQF